MPRSFLIKKNYSHCPLKKRPVLKLDDEKDVADNSEPENLSTKPEDLSLSGAQHQCPHKALTPPPGVALISAAKREPLAHAPPAALNLQSAPPPPGLASPPPPHPAFFAKSSSGGPLEPLNLNTPAEPLHHHHHHHHHHPTAHPQPTHYAPYHAPYGSPPPRAAVAPHYPPPYFSFNYPYPPPAELYGAAHHPAYPPAVLYPLSPARSPLQEQLSPYAPRDTASASPPLPPYMTPPVDAPKLYMPWAQADHCGLSPTSSVASSSSHTAFQSASPPPATPEDLSSPGSVSSGSSSSAGSTSAGSKKRAKDGGAPRYQCPDCAKSYSTYSGLSKHQQFHCAASAGAQAKKSFSCKYCEKVYVSLGALKMHIRTHTLPCKCRICGKAFSRPWLLQGHIRTHTGEKPFSCPHCNRAFADRSNLRAHLQTHSDVKKYSCTSCSKTFSRMSLLTKHTEGGCPGVAALQPGAPGGVAALCVAEHGMGDALMAAQEVGKAYP